MRGCGTVLAFPFFISFVVVIAMMIMNLFVAVVLGGFSESMQEHDASVTPTDFDEFLEKWAEYDPEGKGWISVNDFAFLLNEIHKPLGMLSQRVDLES